MNKNKEKIFSRNEKKGVYKAKSRILPNKE